MAKDTKVCTKFKLRPEMNKCELSLLSLATTLLSFILLIVALSSKEWIVSKGEVVNCHCVNVTRCDTPKTISKRECSNTIWEQTYSLFSTCFEIVDDKKIIIQKCVDFTEFRDAMCKSKGTGDEVFKGKPTHNALWFDARTKINTLISS